QESRDGIAEEVARIRARLREELRAGLPGVDADAARVLARRVVVGRPDDHVVEAVVVHVSGIRDGAARLAPHRRAVHGVQDALRGNGGGGERRGEERKGEAGKDRRAHGWDRNRGAPEKLGHSPTSVRARERDAEKPCRPRAIVRAMWNDARWHLIWIHLPIAATVIAALFLLAAELTRWSWLARAGWTLLALGALGAWFAASSGHGAEDVLGAAATANEAAVKDAPTPVP